jgi:uncharacterized UBP type Zn finger protein
MHSISNTTLPTSRIEYDQRTPPPPLQKKLADMAKRFFKIINDETPTIYAIILTATITAAISGAIFFAICSLVSGIVFYALRQLFQPQQSNPLKGCNNRGNACFMNATKQVIFNDSLLYNAIITTSPSPNNCDNDQKKERKHTAKKLLHTELQNYQNPSTRLLPHSDDLRYFLKETEKNKQEDAGQFIINLLQEIDQAQHPNLFTKLTTFYKWEKEGLSEGVANPFELSELPESNIQTKTDTGFALLPITIPSKASTEKPLNGKQLIEQIFSWQNEDGEHANFLQGGTVYKFKKTQTKIEIDPYPERVILQINRFLMTRQSERKLTTAVTMPETFTINERTYRLHSFIEHRGNTMHNGHYVAYVNKEGMWYEANDAMITKKMHLPDEASTGYLYFYHLVSNALSS